MCGTTAKCSPHFCCYDIFLLYDKLCCSISAMCLMMVPILISFHWSLETYTVSSIQSPASAKSKGTAIKLTLLSSLFPLQSIRNPWNQWTDVYIYIQHCHFKFADISLNDNSWDISDESMQHVHNVVDDIQSVLLSCVKTTPEAWAPIISEVVFCFIVFKAFYRRNTATCFLWSVLKKVSLYSQWSIDLLGQISNKHAGNEASREQAV